MFNFKFQKKKRYFFRCTQQTLMAENDLTKIKRKEKNNAA